MTARSKQKQRGKRGREREREREEKAANNKKPRALNILMEENRNE